MEEKLQALVEEHGWKPRTKKPEPIKEPKYLLVEKEREFHIARAKERAALFRERNIEQRRDWYRKNREKILEKCKEKRENNPEYYKEARKRSYEKHRDKVLLRTKIYRESNKEAYKASRKDREHRRRAATPSWGRLETIQKIKELQAEITEYRAKNQEFHIDHIVPIRGRIANIRLVCGLHIYDNLQLLEAKENISKGCRFWPDMWDYPPNEIEEIKKLCQNNNIK